MQLSSAVLELRSYDLIVKQVSSLKALKTLDLREPPAAFEELDSFVKKQNFSYDERVHWYTFGSLD